MAKSIRSSEIQTGRSEVPYKLSDKRPAIQAEADVRCIVNALIHNPSLIERQKRAGST